MKEEIKLLSLFPLLPGECDKLGGAGAELVAPCREFFLTQAINVFIRHCNLMTV